MRNECNIIRDILPLYVEKMVSSDTISFVEEHLEKCDACRKEYEEMKKPDPASPRSDAAPLLKLKKKMRTKRIQTIALTIVFVTAFLVSAFAVLDAPIYLPYSEDLMTVEPIGDGGLYITFDETVTDFDYDIYLSPNDEKLYYCDVEAWTSLWDKWFSRGKGHLTATIWPQEAYPINLMYVPNDGTEAILVHGEANDEGYIVLPRRTLNFYLLLAFIAFIITAVIWFLARFLTKDKVNVRTWVERIMLYPISYIISQLIIAGPNAYSYSLPRDFALIVFVSLLLYCGLLLAHNVWGLRKEIREINKG